MSRVTGPGPDLTAWERAAEDVDRAEWAFLDALDAGDAERVPGGYLAQCQRHAGRLRKAKPMNEGAGVVARR